MCQSLAGIDDTMTRMKVKVQGLDEEIRTIVRGQADMGHDGRQALEEVHTHILYTYSHTHSQYRPSLHQQVRSHVLSENYIKYCVAVCYVLQAHRTIEELFGRIKNIKEKAEHSEHMVLTCHTIRIRGA